jgi:hypothetical protein
MNSPSLGLCDARDEMQQGKKMSAAIIGIHESCGWEFLAEKIGVAFGYHFIDL